MEMSMHINSTNIDLQKSMVKEKTVQNDSLREKITRCEDIINDQRYLINNQKEEINKERLKQAEIENKYHSEIDYMRKQLEFSQR